MSEAGEPFRLLQAFDEAMKAEGIPETQREHVINRLLYGDPHPGHRSPEQPTIHISGQPMNVPALHQGLAARRANIR
jgi:hypothetical protein